VDEPSGSTNSSGTTRTTEGRPRSAQRVGVNPMDGVHNPSLHANATPVEEGPLAGRFAYLAERGGGRTLPGSTILSGTKLDSRRLALERAARKGEPHGWGSQSPAASERDADRSASRQGRFAYLAEKGVWTSPPVTRRILHLALRAIGCADVRSGIPGSSPWQALPPRATNSSGTTRTAAGWPGARGVKGFGPRMG